jgi:hypothetical protein
MVISHQRLADQLLPAAEKTIPTAILAPSRTLRPLALPLGANLAEDFTLPRCWGWGRHSIGAVSSGWHAPQALDVYFGERRDYTCAANAFRAAPCLIKEELCGTRDWEFYLSQ